MILVLFQEMSSPRPGGELDIGAIAKSFESGPAFVSRTLDRQWEEEAVDIMSRE